MKKLTTILSSSVLALTVLSVSGCSVMTAGVKKGDERNFARSLNDVNAGRAIRARMTRAEGFKLKGVDVEVAQGIVLLSGNVPRAEDRIEAERIAWSGPTIVQVGNELLVKDGQSIIRNSKDGMLHQSVRARLIANSYVKARNYNIEVHDGTVYLMGVARSAEELAMAAQTASTTRGAREVISYVRVAGDQNAQFATGPGFNGQPSVATNQPAPTAPQNYTSETYTPQAYVPQAPAQNYSAPITSSPLTTLDDDAVQSGEPYYLDPQTGERVEIPPGVTPIPYVPETGSLGTTRSPISLPQPSPILPTRY
jgi:osmotically-inducible protein OsmY